MKFITTTNDPLILALVARYKAALAELRTASNAIATTVPETDAWATAIDQMVEKQKDVGQIEVTLCAAFVRGLELSQT